MADFPIQNKGFLIASNVAVGITCFLSIFGSLAIMASFVFFRQHRTMVRFLLFNLSLADFLVAIANLVGVSTSYKYIDANETLCATFRNNATCVVTGGLSMYATDCSILWTIAVMSYLYLALACCRPSRTANVIVTLVSLVFCWGLPMIVLVYFTVKQYFGYEPDFSPGYCTFVRTKDSSIKSSIYIPIIGYQMFLYPAFVILLLISFAFIAHLIQIFRRRSYYQSLYYSSSSWRRAEVKLTFIAFVFIAIRVWGLVNEIGTFFDSYDDSMKFRKSKISAALVFIAGIGDSAQGFVNGLFFCFLIPTIRRRLLHGFMRILCCRCRRREDPESGRINSDDTPSYLSSPSQMSPVSKHSDSKYRSRSVTSLSNMSADRLPDELLNYSDDHTYQSRYIST